MEISIVKVLILQQVERVLGTNSYQQAQVNQWTASIIEQTIAQLTKLNKPYKYIGKIFFVFDE